VLTGWAGLAVREREGRRRPGPNWPGRGGRGFYIFFLFEYGYVSVCVSHV
jgi:hypothetical protein